VETNQTIVIGVGLAYSPFAHRHMLAQANALDFVEIAAAQYLSPTRQRVLDQDGSRLDEVASRLPCFVHGDLLSIGSVETIDRALLARLRRLLERTRAASFSDCLAFDRLGKLWLGRPQALPYSDAAARWVARRCEAVKHILGAPFLLENAAYSFPAPSSCWTEAEFIVRVAEYTDCALLLDLGALFINSQNHHYDPLEFLRGLPGERVAQIRIGGVRHQAGEWRHDRGKPAPDEIFALLDAALAITDADSVVIARDGGYSPFSAVIDEVSRARQIFARRRAHAPAGRRHFAPGKRAGEVGGILDDFDELESVFSTLRRYQLTLIERCLSSDGNVAGLSAGEQCDKLASIPAARLRSLTAEISARSGHVSYLKDFFQEQQLVAWMMRDARARR
jgi:uncharacterized protein (UPF0276 family)